MNGYKQTIETLISIKENKKSALKFADLEKFLSTLVENHKPENNGDESLITELKQILSDVSNLKSDLESGKTGDDEACDILPLSIVDLTEIMKVLEGAANDILLVAEQLNSLKSGNEKVDQELATQASKLFESCNFQDLTGQRIVRVIKNLERFQNTFQSIIKVLMGLERVENNQASINYKFSGLQNGPQLAKKRKIPRRNRQAT